MKSLSFLILLSFTIFCLIYNVLLYRIFRISLFCAILFLFLDGQSLFLGSTLCFNLDHILSLAITPFAVYTNLNVNKKFIFKENKGKSGVYRWTNKVTGASYIGSAVDLTRRFREYYSTNYLKKELLRNNSVVYKALLKYGYFNFTLEILEYCNKLYTIKREQYFIDLLKPSYNLCSKAGSSLGRITLANTRLKLRYAWLLRQYKSHKGKDITFFEFILDNIEKKINRLELKICKLQNILEKITNKPVSKVSKETRIKILDSSKTAKAVKVTDLVSGVTTTYPSARRAAEALNISNSTVMNKLNKNNTKLYKGKYIIKKF